MCTLTKTFSRVSKSLKTFGKTMKRSFNNYIVNKKSGLGVNGKSTMGHVTKACSYYVKNPQLSTLVGGGEWVKIE